MNGATPDASTMPVARQAPLLPWRAVALYVVAVALACFALWPALHGPLLLDDFPQLLPMMNTIDSANWTREARTFLFSDSGPSGRPVSMLTFVGSALACGQDVSCWKYANLMLHLLNGAVIFWLTSRIAGVIRGSRDWTLGAAVAATWLLHPLHVSTVMYTVQRMTQLSTLFILLGLLAYVVGRQRMLAGAAKPGAALVAVAFGVCFPLALLSKENGVLFPLLAWLVEACIFRLRGTPAVRRGIGLLFGLVLLLPAVVGGAFVAFNFQRYVGAGFEFRNFTLTERLLTEGRVLVMHLYQLLAAQPASMWFHYDNFPVSHGWFDPVSTFWSWVGLACLAGFAWAIRVRAPLVALGIALFFAGHVLESTALALELVFEHRNYLPAYGIALAVVASADALVRNRRILLGAVGIALLALSGGTAARATAWSSEQTLYPYLQALNPDSLRIRTAFADAFTTTGRFDEARRFLDGLAGTGPALQRLYIDCKERHTLADGSLEGVRAGMKGVIGLYEAEGLIQLANAGLDDTCRFSRSAFVAVLDGALTQRVRDGSTRQKLLIFKAHYLHAGGDVPSALTALEASWAARPDNPIPLFLGAEWMLDEKRGSDARRWFERAQAVAGRSLVDYREFSGPIRARLTQAHS